MESKFDFGMLKTNICTVTFTKKSGEERVMKCTKNFGAIAEEFHPKTEGVHKEGLQKVFDLEKNAWRSFREDSVTAFEVVEPVA